LIGYVLYGIFVVGRRKWKIMVDTLN
jgi:hypothetical protein